jgi:hypothetical protein
MRKLLVAALVLVFVVSSFAAFGAQPKTYQVTGIVKSVSADLIVVDKGKENFEIGRDAATKVTGDLKVGAKVTIHYRMSAASVEVKK